jgi:L-ascorbate metabolism protein UlaG (beta-lactamase superfamily)
MNKTLWCSWVIASPRQRLFYAGDTGPTRAFEEIGRRYGPFDLTLMPIGAYGDEWPDIHLTPEQAVTAHVALKGKRLLPVHWGTFDVALHPWEEPIKRLMSSVRENHVEIVTPLLGEVVRVDAEHSHSGKCHP